MRKDRPSLNDVALKAMESFGWENPKQDAATLGLVKFAICVERTRCAQISQRSAGISTDFLVDLIIDGMEERLDPKHIETPAHLMSGIPL